MSVWCTNVMPPPMTNLSFASQQDSGCKNFKIIA
jgi:hypothetical protein